MSTIQELYKIYLRHPLIVTDSRKVKSDCLFFALKGEHFNGNQFAAKAVAEGAAFAIIDEEEFKLDERYILVGNVLETLQNLANHHRRQLQIPVLAITGSNGKTTTKELVNAVLSSTYPTHCTQGNFNNHIGLPLTLLAMPVHTQIAVIEMGANHLGEIDFLCRIAEPTHGLITNIGKAHLEGFGGIDGVKQGKSELFRFLLERRNGVAFINLDEPYLKKLAGDLPNKIFYKKGDNCTSDRLPFEVELMSESPFLKICFCDDGGNPVEVQSKLTGAYNFNNIMTAVVLGTYFKVPGNSIKVAIENYLPANNRSQLVQAGSNIILLDAYNANPTSMKNALVSFAKMEAERKVVVLGAMRELGGHSETEHQSILDLATASGFTEVLLVGPEFEKAAKKGKVHFFQETEEAGEWLKKKDYTNTYFLLKASRSIGLERLVDGFKQRETPC